MTAAPRGVISSPKSPWSKEGSLGSAVPETVLQSPGPVIRNASVYSADAATMSIYDDYVVTPIKSRRDRRVPHGPYSTRPSPIVQRHRSRRRNIDSVQWSQAGSRGSDVPPAPWVHRRTVTHHRFDADGLPPRRDPIRYVGRDPENGLDFVETRHGTRKYLRDGPRRQPTKRHPRRGNDVETESLEGSYGSVVQPRPGQWNPTIKHTRHSNEISTLRRQKPPSGITVKGSDRLQRIPTFSDDSIENMKGSDVTEVNRKGDFVPHWGYYVQTPPTPGQSVKPRQGSVLDPHYKPNSRALDRDLLSPRSFSKSMIPDHGSTLTSPSQRGSQKSDESGFHEPMPRYQETYGPAYQSGPYQQGPQYQAQGRAPAYQANRGGYGQRGQFGGRGQQQGEKAPRAFDRNYICTVSGVLKIVQFVASVLIAGISQADTDKWGFEIFVLFVGISGILLSISSFFFRLFHWENSAHVGCLWFEFSCYLVVSLLMLTAAIMSTLSASLAPSIAALTVFCFLGTGVFVADMLIIGAGLAQKGRDSQGQGQGQGPGGYPGRGGPGGPGGPGGYPGGPGGRGGY